MHDVDRRQHGLRPILRDAATAHTERELVYADDGTAICRFPQLSQHDLPEQIEITPSQQYPLIRATFDDLNKALSRLSNSPRLDDGMTLREAYEREAGHYETLAAQAYAEGRWEPDYGTYMLDHTRGDLYLLAPARWHRLGLVTSNALIATDPACSLSWREVRARFEGAVLGFAGLSVGGNLLEGWLREARPREVKLADPDWVELGNFNRLERASVRHLVGSRARRFDARNPYEMVRVPKAEYVAYEQQLVDPYLVAHVYADGINRNNLDRFLLGDGDEPRIDVLVEETDNLELKLLMRERCRELGIDVLMLSDFGHRAHVMWNFFAADRSSPLGFIPDDVALHDTYARVRAGDRSALEEFIRRLCGDDSCGAQFQAWLEGRGEQPTGSLPQAGATAMSAGGIGGKELALHVLGHNRERAQRRAIYDLLDRKVIVD